MAISQTGIKDDNMIYHSSKYYKMTQKYFQDYKNHQAVRIVGFVTKSESIL